MTDPHELARRLFEAGRSEQPGPELRGRLLATPLESEPPSVFASLRASFGSRRFLFPASAALALVLAFILVWPGRGNAPKLAPEPATARSSTPLEATGVEEPPPVPEQPALVPVPPRPRTTAEPKPAATLSVELDSLRRARQALSSGDTTAALRELDRYEREIQGRQLRAEAALLRIETLSQRGDATAASRLASDFVERHPNSPLVDRARTFLVPSPSASK